MGSYTGGHSIVIRGTFGTCDPADPASAFERVQREKKIQKKQSHRPISVVYYYKTPEELAQKAGIKDITNNLNENEVLRFIIWQWVYNNNPNTVKLPEKISPETIIAISKFPRPADWARKQKGYIKLMKRAYAQKIGNC